jgi:hypothetical protein
MKKDYLLPHYFKKIGLGLCIPFIAGCLYCLFWDGADKLPCKTFAIASEGLSHTKWFGIYDGGGILDEICMIGLIISFLLICFSKEKNEDEMIKSIRMNSLIWSLIVSSGILIFGIMFFYEFAFLNFTFIYLFIIYLLFIVKFHCELYKFRRNIDE